MAESTSTQPGRIFISYRREDTAYPASWLFDRLTAHFSRAEIFKDINSIQLGEDFADAIIAAVESCSILLALIGDRWLTATGEDGQRRLDNPEDFVRLEIEAALTRGIRVIPILVEGARMPLAGELPPSLSTLVRRQALELSSSRFSYDSGLLIGVLDQALAEIKTQAIPAPDPDTVDGRPDHERLGRDCEPPDRSRVPTSLGRVWASLRHARARTLTGSGILVMSATAALVYVLVSSHTPRTPHTPPTATAKVIFSDNFTSRSAGWTITTSHARGRYIDGAYQFSVDPGYAETSVPQNPPAIWPAAPSDITVTATAYRTSGTATNDQYGIMCRGYGIQAYFFMVANNSATIAKYLPSGLRTLSSVPANAINVNGSNKLRASCASVPGSRAVHLVFWVNDTQVAAYTDSSNPLPDGSVGIMAGAFSKPAGAVFSDFSVTVPVTRR